MFRGETTNETEIALHLLKPGDSGNLHSAPAAEELFVGWMLRIKIVLSTVEVSHDYTPLKPIRKKINSDVCGRS